jgi:hypothetical protein
MGSGIIQLALLEADDLFISNPLVLSKRFIEFGGVPIRHHKCASKH